MTSYFPPPLFSGIPSNCSREKNNKTPCESMSSIFHCHPVSQILHFLLSSTSRPVAFPLIASKNTHQGLRRGRCPVQHPRMTAWWKRCKMPKRCPKNSWGTNTCAFVGSMLGVLPFNSNPKGVLSSMAQESSRKLPNVLPPKWPTKNGPKSSQTVDKPYSLKTEIHGWQREPWSPRPETPPPWRA